MWLLWLFTGVLGGHRFYLGNYGIGTLQLLTCGGFGVWTLADAFLISNRARNIENGVEPRWKF
ncbi:MAG TPA: TM2 domain-containing protein [Corynebacterium flavescens]|nr:TM2 domain-containing protein [Corynebacterium flavescens]HCG47056.1 TM2 domain-containing protein [Corynebacterium flavescens]